MITYIIVGFICLLIGFALGSYNPEDEMILKNNNNQPQINIIIDGKSIEECLKKGMNENDFERKKEYENKNS